MAKNNNLTDFLTDIADTIREKKGYPTAQKINPQNFSNEILTMNSLEVGDITTADKSGDSNFMLCDGGSVKSVDYPTLTGIIPTTITWSSYGSQIGDNNVIAYGNGLWLASNGNGKIVTSTNGITWTTRNVSGFTTSDSITYIGYVNGLYIVGGSNGKYGTSSDGITFTTQNIFTRFTTYGVVYVNDTWYVVGQYSNVSYANFPIILKSTDNATWTNQYLDAILPTSSYLKGITYANNMFVVIGAIGGIATSTDGITWTSRYSNNTATMNEIAYGNGIFVVATSTGLLTSTDGITWTSRGNSGNCVVFNNGTFIAGKNGGILTSTDGTSWQSVTTGLGLSSSKSVRHIAYGNGTYIGTVLSNNGIKGEEYLNIPKYLVPAYIKVN